MFIKLNVSNIMINRYLNEYLVVLKKMKYSSFNFFLQVSEDIVSVILKNKQTCLKSTLLITVNFVAYFLLFNA